LTFKLFFGDVDRNNPPKPGRDFFGRDDIVDAFFLVDNDDEDETGGDIPAPNEAG
jgi:hypothetical protein